MAVRYITKGKGRKRKVIPIKPKKGVSVRSVSLQPSSVVKINKEQIKLLNKGQSATFSKALNKVVMRAKRDGIPIYDTHVNSNDRRKPYHMWIVKHPEKGDKIKGSDTIVMAEHYGQAIDDLITVWNKEKRKNMTIGYPQVQGTAEKSFRFARSEDEIRKRIAFIEAQKRDISNDPEKFGIRSQQDFQKTLDEGNKEIAQLEVELEKAKSIRKSRDTNRVRLSREEKKYTKEELVKAFADYREQIPEKELKKDGRGKYRIQVAGKIGEDNWIPFNMNVTANSKAEAEEDVRNTVGLHGTPLLLAIKLKE